MRWAILILVLAIAACGGDTPTEPGTEVLDYSTSFDNGRSFSGTLTVTNGRLTGFSAIGLQIDASSEIPGGFRFWANVIGSPGERVRHEVWGTECVETIYQTVHAGTVNGGIQGTCTLD